MKTLTFRLTLWYASVVTVTVGVIIGAGRFYLERNLVKGIDFLNAAEFEEISHRLESEPNLRNPEAIAEAIRLHTEIDASLFYFQVARPDGEILFLSSNMAGHVLPEPVHGNTAFSVHDEELGHLRVAEYTYNGMDIHIASSLESVDALFDGFYVTAFWILIMVFILSLALGVFLSRVALNPVSEIQSIARRISARNLHERIPVPPGGDEISQLSEFLNEMFDRLEGAFQQISRFTADASHELRTPLSLIRLHGERLLQNPEMPEAERMEALSEQMAEIERLNKLIDDLLFIAKADAGVLPLNRKEVDLEAYLSEFSEDATILCEEQGIHFERVHEEQAVRLSFDPVWLRHVLLNLLSNAMRASPPDSHIRLLSQPAPDGFWRFTLEDEGYGLPESEVERIFERFQRHQDGNGGEERSPGGTGLGLAICRSIITKHGGRIYATVRTDPSGLRVHIELPISVD